MTFKVASGFDVMCILAVFILVTVASRCDKVERSSGWCAYSFPQSCPVSFYVKYFTHSGYLKSVFPPSFCPSTMFLCFLQQRRHKSLPLLGCLPEQCLSSSYIVGNSKLPLIGEGIFIRIVASKWQSQDLNPGLLILASSHLFIILSYQWPF